MMFPIAYSITYQIAQSCLQSFSLKILSSSSVCQHWTSSSKTKNGVGSPGSGKGPVCEELARKWGWMTISVGDEVRIYCEDHEGMDDDIVVQSKRKSELVPVEELAQVLNHRIQDCRNAGYKSFLIDGFPRDVAQIEYIQEHVRSHIFGPGFAPHILLGWRAWSGSPAGVRQRDCEGSSPDTRIFGTH